MYMTRQARYGFGPGGQRGLAGAIFLVIILIGMVMGALAYMNRGYNTGVTEQSARINASVMMKQGSDLKDGFDRMQITTGTTASTITFDSDVTTGLFNPAPGAQYAIRPMPPANAVVPSATPPVFTYSQHVQLPGVGASSTPDIVATLGDVNKITCQAVNHALYNDPSSDEPPVSAGSLSDWTPAVAASGSTIDDSGSVAVNYNMRSEGCVATSDGHFVYYKALSEN
jgi:hypothetical protein